MRMKSLVAVGVAALAVASANQSAQAAVVVDTFTAAGGSVAFPLTDTIRTVSNPQSEAVDGVFGGLRTVVVGALLPTPVPNDLTPFEDDVATLALDTAAGTLTASATPDVGFATLLAFSGTTAPPDVDVSGEDRLLLDYSATGDVTLELTLSNTNSSGFRTAASSTGTLTLPAGSGVFEILFSDVDQVVRGPFGGQIVDLPAVDLTSLDAVVLDFRSVGQGGSLTLDSIVIVPEPASALVAAPAALLALRRRRREA